ncbi:MAG: hypothetical protein OK454_02150 [Thaumarchaeota archaeon]|nr:hypothetical protein [Nitrososphaerota archaeon]
MSLIRLYSSGSTAVGMAATFLTGEKSTHRNEVEPPSAPATSAG